MAVRFLHVLVCGFAGCVVPALAAADGSDGPWVRGLWQQGEVKFHELREFLGRQLSMPRREASDWIVDLSHEAIDPGRPPGADAAQLVVQQDRRDGTDLLTLRYPLAQRGAMLAYAGAGFNQTGYLVEAREVPTLFTRHDRPRSLGAAAEVGAEFRVSQQLMVNAELRWAEFDPDANLLRGAEGLAVVDPVSVGVSIGWRFR
jgi:hypothetical protein